MIIEPKSEKKRGLTRIRIVSLVVMAILVFWLSFMVYKWFGVTDTEGWLDDVGMLLLMFVLVIGAAGAVAWLIMFVRGRTDKD